MKPKYIPKIEFIANIYILLYIYYIIFFLFLSGIKTVLYFKYNRNNVFVGANGKAEQPA